MGLLLLAIAVPLMIGGIGFYQLYVVPTYHAPPIPLPKVSQIVTFTADAYGHAKGTLSHAFQNITIQPHIVATAVLHANHTKLSGADIQATLSLVELQYSNSKPNIVKGEDQTVYTWNFTLEKISAGVVNLTADLVFQITNCGQCANTTLKIPVELQLTMSAM